MNSLQVETRIKVRLVVNYERRKAFEYPIGSTAIRNNDQKAEIRRRYGKQIDEERGRPEEKNTSGGPGKLWSLAERVGFEPTIRYNRIPDFESGAFDHSATFPCEFVILSELPNKMDFGKSPAER